MPSSRRTFLDRLGKVLGIAALAELAGMAAAFLAPREENGEPGPGMVSAGLASELPPGSVRAFPAGRFYLVRLADGGFLALASRCTHLGCTVLWNAREQVFPCPCHGSAFDLRGEVRAPPAPRPLDVHPVSFERGVVRVDTSRRLERTRFEPGQAAYAKADR